MEYLIKGENLAKIKAGMVGSQNITLAGCGGNDIYCRTDGSCGMWSQCIHPTTYAGCSSGVLTFLDPNPKPDN